MNDNPKTFLEHINELRNFIVKSSFCVFIFTAIAFLFIDDIFDALMNPILVALKDAGLRERMVYTSITELFTTHFRIAFYSALFISSPYILYQAWLFIKPALFCEEREVALLLLRLSPLLFFLGGGFAFFIIIPHILQILMQFSPKNMEFLPKISENVSFIVILLISFGLSFQMPLIAYSLDKLGVLPAQTLRKRWKEAVIGIVVVSAIITPPDAFSMLFLAGPLIFLYAISMLIVSKKK